MMKRPIPFELRHDGPDSYAIEWEGAVLLEFWDGGKSACLGEASFAHFSWQDVLRWGTPYALAPQGRVFLHGSAARHSFYGVAFLGIGGAGKSTLARELSERAWDALADDIMLCDQECRINSRGEEILHAWIESLEGNMEPGTAVDYGALAGLLDEPGNQDWLRLDGLFFLDEVRSPGAQFVFRPLPVGRYFEKLVEYGFGGLPNPLAWESQFRLYATLAKQVPGGMLGAPSGLDRMRAALPRFEEDLPIWLKQCQPLLRTADHR